MSGDDKPEPRPWGTPHSGGKRGSGDRQPGGPTPGGRGPFDPRGRPSGGGRDFDDLQQRLTDFVRRRLGGPDGQLPPRRWLPYAGGILALLFLLSGVVVVGAREVAVVTTFGAWSRSYGPGLGYYLPLVEKARKVNTTSLQKTEIDATTSTGNNLMLTGDENIVDLSFSVTWRVSDPGAYLFNVAEPRETIAAVAESAMREVIGRNALDSIISRGRSQIQSEVAELMQRVLDSYRAGVFIDGVQISEAGPPKEVINAFRDVNNASQNAVSYANQARGQAARIRQQALGYRAQVVREAAGEAARFNQVYEQYRLAPGVTRDRLYIETMQRVLSNSNKVIIDGKGVTAPIVLSPDVFKPRTAVPTASAEPAANPQGDGQ